jgi:hypothetical protein
VAALTHPCSSQSLGPAVEHAHSGAGRPATVIEAGEGGKAVWSSPLRSCPGLARANSVLGVPAVLVQEASLATLNQREGTRVPRTRPLGTGTCGGGAHSGAAQRS